MSAAPLANKTVEPEVPTPVAEGMEPPLAQTVGDELGGEEEAPYGGAEHDGIAMPPAKQPKVSVDARGTPGGVAALADLHILKVL